MRITESQLKRMIRQTINEMSDDGDPSFEQVIVCKLILLFYVTSCTAFFMRS